MQSLKTMRLCRGITLLELMIVVAVIGILAAIAYPQYQQSMQRGRRSIAQLAVQNCAAAQERFYSRNSRYSLAVPQCNGNVAADGAIGGAGVNYYALRVTNAPCGNIQNCYQVTAVPIGPQAGDLDCPAFTLDSLGVRTPAAGTTKCW